MDRIRMGVIGLGWFDEIHCDAIASVPNLELVALCTRRPDRLAELAMKYNTARTYRDYSDLLADSTIDLSFGNGCQAIDIPGGHFEPFFQMRFEIVE